MIRFELLKEAHIDSICRLESLCFAGEAWTRQMFESELENRISLFIVGIDEESGEVACYGGAWLIADVGEITNIAVSPELRRQGLGAKLLELLIQVCEERRMTSINLEVKEFNSPAVNLYEKYGFQVVGRREGYYRDGSDALLMTKSI